MDFKDFLICAVVRIVTGFPDDIFKALGSDGLAQMTAPASKAAVAPFQGTFIESAIPAGTGGFHDDRRPGRAIGNADRFRLRRIHIHKLSSPHGGAPDTTASPCAPF